MSDDIVERLRDRATLLVEPGIPSITTRLCAEAAAEIERLRALADAFAEATEILFAHGDESELDAVLARWREARGCCADCGHAEVGHTAAGTACYHDGCLCDRYREARR